MRARIREERLPACGVLPARQHDDGPEGYCSDWRARSDEERLFLII